MPAITPVNAAGFILHAGFLSSEPVFASGDGGLVVGMGGKAVPLHKGGMLVAVSDGKALLTGGDDGTVRRSLSDGSSEIVGERPRKWIDQIAMGPGGAVAYASGRQVWVREANGTVYELTRPSAVSGLCFFPKGLRLAVAGYNGVGLWYPGTATPPAELVWKGSHIAVTMTPDGANIVTSMQETALHGWRLKDGQHMRMSGYPAKVKSMSWSAKGRFLITSGANASIGWPFHTKDGPMGKRPLELGGRQEMVTCVAAHPAEEITAIGYDDGMILLVRFDDGEEVLLRRPDGVPVSAMGWDKSGLRLAFGSEAGSAGVVDLAA